MHTLLIENVSDAFLQDFVALANTAKATISEQSEQSAECPICKAHDYTLSESAEKRILESLAEIENARQNGTLQTFSNVEELMEELRS